MDANAYGNVARFMNHSCDANLTKQVKSPMGYAVVNRGTPFLWCRI